MAFAQDNNQDDQNNQGNQVVTTGGGQQSLAKGGLAGNAAQTAPGQKQGSGRFTNLSSYVKANQQGAQNLAQRVGSGIQNQLSSKEKDVTNQTQEVSKGVTAGQGTLDTGGQEQKRLADIASQFQGNQNFSVLNADRGAFGQAQKQAQDFVKNNPNYQTFKNVQSGQAVDEANLQNQFSKAQEQSNLYQNLFNQRQSQIGNATGRQEALSEFIGGQGQAVRPAYSTGQKRLDNLILGQNSQALQSLINKVGSNKANVDAALQQVGTTGTNVTNLINREAELQKAIADSAKAAQSGFQTAFNQDKVNELNAARQASYDADRNALTSGNLSGDLYNRLGLSGAVVNPDVNDILGFSAKANLGFGDTMAGGIQDFGLIDRIKNSQGDLDAYLKRQTAATSANDLLRNEDVSTDEALADIFGGGQQFTKAADLSTNTTLDSAKFMSDLNARRNQYMDLLNKHHESQLGFGTGDAERDARSRQGFENDFQQAFGYNPNDMSRFSSLKKV